jgi:hypothetical protein
VLQYDLIVLVLQLWWHTPTLVQPVILTPAIPALADYTGYALISFVPCGRSNSGALQAIAKIAVRSGEPFRVQCYSILATAAGGSIAHRARSSSRGGPTAAAGSSSNSQAAAAASAAAAAAVAEGASADPLGIAAVAGPALEVLDHMYAGTGKQCTHGISAGRQDFTTHQLLSWTLNLKLCGDFLFGAMLWFGEFWCRLQRPLPLLQQQRSFRNFAPLNSADETTLSLVSPDTVTPYRRACCQTAAVPLRFKPLCMAQEAAEVPGAAYHNCSTNTVLSVT